MATEALAESDQRVRRRPDAVASTSTEEREHDS
jgi:hypothetical protein